MKTETQNYKPLVAGDTYQQGDETRHTGLTIQNVSTAPTKCGPWSNVASGMFGHKVLPADLIAAEFRRKV